MIRVAFFPPGKSSWMGGVNYFKNLFYALREHSSSDLEIVVFLPPGTEHQILSIYAPFVTECHIVNFIDKNTISGFLSKIEYRIFGKSFLAQLLLNPHRIDVISHASLYGLGIIPTISWIPDFQHLYLPEMFTAREIVDRNNYFLKLIERSDAVFVSSNDSKNDLIKFSPLYSHKAKVLRFVSQPEEKYFGLDASDLSLIEKKYSLPKNYFYIPNQFWRHKNHLVVFEAIKLLRDQGKSLYVVCSGNLQDYRAPEYIQTLRDFITINQLQDNIKLLGVVPYGDVFALIKFSIAVINPSLFEGWSSTVEECKSVNKQLILSDITVHKEQAPHAVFFERNSAKSLAEVLSDYSNLNESVDFDLAQRTKLFANSYMESLRSVLHDA